MGVKGFCQARGSLLPGSCPVGVGSQLQPLPCWLVPPGGPGGAECHLRGSSFGFLDTASIAMPCAPACPAQEGFLSTATQDPTHLPAGLDWPRPVVGPGGACAELREVTDPKVPGRRALDPS